MLKRRGSEIPAARKKKKYLLLHTLLGSRPEPSVLEDSGSLFRHLNISRGQTLEGVRVSRLIRAKIRVCGTLLAFTHFMTPDQNSAESEL